MTTSAYMPAVEVEIAFDSGVATPAVDRTWTDVSDYVELEQIITIRRGREDENSTITPSTLTLTLDNSDGRFTPELTTGAYYPNVKLGRPIRVTSTPVGGAASVRFVGYVDEWLLVWDAGTDSYASVTVTANGRAARLGNAAELRSQLEEEFLLLEPIAYYTTSEPEGATQASESSGLDVAPLAEWDIGGSTSPAFGQGIGPAYDGLSGVRTDFDGNALEATIDVTAGSDFSVLWFFTTVEASTSGMLGWGGLYVNHGTWSGGKLSLEVEGNGTEDASAGDYEDGETHYALLTWDDSTSTANLYLDGTLEATRTGSPGDFGRLTLGANVSSNFLGGEEAKPDPVYTIDAHFFHVGVFDRILDLGGGELANLLIAANLGAAYTPSAMLARIATYAGIPAAEQDLATTAGDVSGLTLTGKTAVAAMLEVEQTDGGILYDDRDGDLVYQARDVRYLAAAEVTLSVALQEIEANYAPRVDRSALLNDVTAADPSGNMSVRARDAASVEEHGSYTESITLLTSDEDTLRQAAWWRVNTRAEPKLRTPTLSVNLPPFSQARQDAILGLDISSRLTITGLPSQAPAATVDYFVEGYTETIGPEAYVLTFNVADGSPWLSVFIVDDATRGRLDEGNTVAY